MLRFKKPESKNEAPKNKLRRAFKPEGKAAADSVRALPAGDSRLSLFSIFLFALLLFSLYLAYRLAEPFIHSIIMGIVFAALSAPIYLWAMRRTCGRRVPAALVTLALLLLCGVFPLAVFLKKLIPQAMDSISTISTWLSQHDVEQIMSISWVKSTLEWVHENLPFASFSQAEIQDALLSVSKTASQYVIRGAGAILQNTLTFTMHFVLVLLVMFFMLLDGPRLLARLQYLSPLRRRQNEAIVTNLRRVARAVLVGGLLVAVLQGIAGGVGMAIVGMPALFCGTMMAVASLVPVLGTGLVWVPVAAWLLITGQTWQGAFIIAWCVLLVTNIDTFLRPIFMRNSAGLSTFFLFMSIIGGLNVFGMLGIFYGPLILGFAVVMVSLYGEEYHDFLTDKMRTGAAIGAGAHHPVRSSAVMAGAGGQRSPRATRYMRARRRDS